MEINYKELAKKYIETKQYNKVIELQEIWQDEQLANNIFVEGQMIRLEVIKWINIHKYCIKGEIMTNIEEVIKHTKNNITYNQDDIDGTKGRLINLIDEYNNTNKVGYLLEAKTAIEHIIDYEVENKVLKNLLVQLEG